MLHRNIFRNMETPMSWLTEIQDAAGLRERTARSMSLPFGLANPLWLAFGAAASAGAAWWLMTRWSRPVNVEAAPALEDGKLASRALPRVESPAPVAQTAPENVSPSVAGDDLTQLRGVGPRTAAALAERGVTRFAQLAAWSAEQMAAFDSEMKLKGRSVRDAWLDQACRLAEAGRPSCC